MPNIVQSASNLYDSQQGAAVQVQATLTPGLRNIPWLAGLCVCGGGATAGQLVACSVTGLCLGTTFLFSFVSPTGAGVTLPPVLMTFDPPLQGLPNTPIVVTVPSFGAGNLAASVSAWGWASQA